jgi:hypothetical protein
VINDCVICGGQACYRDAEMNHVCGAHAPLAQIAMRCPCGNFDVTLSMRECICECQFCGWVDDSFTATLQRPSHAPQVPCHARAEHNLELPHALAAHAHGLSDLRECLGHLGE